MTSASRTVYLPADPSQYLTELAWPPKGPTDVVDCTLDATLFLADENVAGGSDTIATVGALVLSGTLTGTLTSQTATTITWTFGGGTFTTPPSTYTIGVSFTTAAGNVITRNIYMTVITPTLYQGNPQDIAVVEGPPGGIGVGVVSTAQPDGPSTFVLVLTDGSETNPVALPPGSPGAQGVSVVNAVQPAAAEVAFTLSNGSQTAAVSLPAGPQGLIGPPGPSIQPFSIAGTWNAASNSPSLSAGGQGEAAQTGLLVTTAGTTSLDGNAVWNLGDVIVTTGTAWLRAPFGGSLGSQFPTLTIGTTGQLLDDGSSYGGIAIQDKAGFRYGKFDGYGAQFQVGSFAVATIGTMTVLDTGGNTLLATDPLNALVTLPGGLVLQSDAGGFNISTKDRFLLFSVNAAGYFFGTPGAGQAWLGGSQSSTFGAADFAAHTAAALAYTAAIRNTPIAGIHIPSAGLELLGVTGASRSIGEQGAPALSTTPYLDNLMLGQSSRAQALTNGQTGHQSNQGAYVCVGGATLEPLVATNQITANNTPGGLATVPGGIITNATGVVVTGGTVGSPAGTYTWSGGSGTGSLFAAGTGLQFAGFGTLTANNAVPTNGSTMTVASASGQQIITVEPPPATGTDGGTITIASVNYAFFGESLEIGWACRFREAQLNAYGIPLATGNPASRLLPFNFGISGSPIANFLPGQTYWSRLTTFVSQAQTAAGTLTVGLSALLIDEGSNEYNNDVSKATYKAELLTFMTSVYGSIAVGSGSMLNQAGAPLILLTATDGQQLSDFSTGTLTGSVSGTVLTVSSIGSMACDPGANLSGGSLSIGTTVGTQLAGTPGGVGTYQVTPSQNVSSTSMTLTEYMAITMAQAELSGCAPYTGFSTPALPYLTLASGHFGPAHSGHNTNNAYRLRGDVIAKIYGQMVLPRPVGHKPPHIIAVTVRGTEWLIDFHFPSGHGSTQAAYIFMQPTVFADWGLAPKDSVGNLSVASVSWASPTSVLLVANRAAVSSPTLWIADQTLHSGVCNIFDADPIYCEDTYSYTAGSGQCLGENYPGPQSASAPLANGQPLALYEMCIPAVVPAVFG